MSSHQARLARAVALAALLLAGPAVAQPSRPLPDADVITPAGALVKLSALGTQGQWLVLYVSESSTPSARLLEALASWGLGDALGRVVVVINGAADAQPLAAQWEERLPGVKWASDPSSSVARGAGLRGTPTVIGARGAEIGWVLAGVLNDPGMVRDVVRGWLNPIGALR